MTCPLLVIHGEEDTLIRPSHGRKLVEAATVADKQYLGIRGAGHNDLFDHNEAKIHAAILEFARRVVPVP